MAPNCHRRVRRQAQPTQLKTIHAVWNRNQRLLSALVHPVSVSTSKTYRGRPRLDANPRSRVVAAAKAVQTDGKGSTRRSWRRRVRHRHAA